MNGPTFASQSASNTPTPAPGKVQALVRAPNPRSPLPVPPSEEGVMALRLWTYFRLYWLTILFCGSILGAGLAYTAWNLLPAKYESYALLQVASAPSYIANQNDPNRGRTEFITYLKTTAQLIKSEFVLNSALNDPKYRISELPTLAEQKDPIKYLDEKVQVSYSDGSEVIRVSIEGERPSDVRKIVDAVKDAYYREVVEREIQQKTLFKYQVEQARTALEGMVKSKQGSKPASFPILANGQEKVDPNDPAVVQAKLEEPKPIDEPDAIRRVRANMALNRVFTLQNQIDEYPLLMAEKSNEIESLKKQIELLRKGDPSQEVMAQVEQDQEVQAAEGYAQRLRDDARYLEKITLNPDSDRVRKAKQASADADVELRKLKEEKAFALEQGKRQGEANKLFVQLDKVERELRSLQERERVAKKQLEDAKTEVAKMPAEEKAALEAKAEKPLVDISATDLLTHDSIYAKLTAQLIGLDFELKSPPRVNKLQDASTPSQKDLKKQLLGTAFAGMLGFVLVGVGLIGYETSARKISSLAELKMVGPGPVVGVVPWNPDGRVPSPEPVANEVQEAIDKLRSYVAQTWLSRGATTVTVTSPLGDEGKGFTAYHLASGLARAGYRTLVIDFDLREPSLHLYANLPNGAGVCELLRGESDPKEAVVAAPNGLWMLPAGHWSEDIRKSAVGGRLEMLMNRLKEPFDCVVLHTHALLTAAETIEIARRSEVVLMCSLYRETRLPLLRRAADRVSAMEVPYSGVVYLGASVQESLC